MMRAPIPADDEARVDELGALCILDTPPEERFDRITRAAASLLQVPIALVSLVDHDRQWFKSRTGIGVTETGRDISFCGHAILAEDVFIVEDASRDWRFADNPLVTGDLGLRFYAGMPLRTPRGHMLGTLCVIDRVPRSLSAAELTILRDLAGWAEMALNLRDLESANRSALQTSRQLQSVLDSATDAIIVLDDQLRIQTFNKAAEHTFGRGARDLNGRPLDLLMTPVALRSIRASVAAMAKPGARQRTVLPKELAVLRADGTQFIADVRLSRMDDESGLRYTMILRDITDSHMAFECLEAMNRKIAESLSLQQAILDGTRCAVIACTADGKIVLFNAGAERMLGYTAQDMLYRESPLRFHAPDEIIARARELSQALGRSVAPGFEVFSLPLLEGGSEEREWTFVHRDGSLVPVLLSLSALYDDKGKITGFVGIAHDLTEMKQLEEMKTDFVATVSHELRTPLTSIKGAIDLLTMTELSPASSRLLDIAGKNCARLTTMVNDILDLEKIDRRKMQFDCQWQSLTPVVTEAVRSMLPYAHSHGVFIDWAGDDESSAYQSFVDAGRIAQVVVNLLSNAIKFSERGSTVSVSIRRADNGCQVAVRDSGLGIPESFHDRIFEKFAQAGPVSRRGRGGTGLGLAICKAIIEQQQGVIGFTSELGVGSEFYFVLPSADDTLPC